MRLDFQREHVTGHRMRADQDPITIDQRYAVAPFDSNVQDLVVAALPLVRHFRARLPVYVYERGGLVWIEIRVLGRERLASAAGVDSVWVVEVSRSGRPSGRYWITDRPSVVVRSEYALPDGGTFRIGAPGEVAGRSLSSTGLASLLEILKRAMAL